jgi:hypothetical protein
MPITSSIETEKDRKLFGSHMKDMQKSVSPPINPENELSDS